MAFTFDMYKARLGAQTPGRARKMQSDLIMDATFTEDIQYMVGYFYDYYHDDEPLIYRNLHSYDSASKTPIDLKFIVNAHNSENKDQVGYYIQFRTSQLNPIDYYADYEKKWDCEFPVGLYVDLPDEKGNYRKWLITERADWLGLQFPTWYILPIDYVLQWVYQADDGRRIKYQMCGVGRSQSSYNAGVWLSYKFEELENQRKMILPINEISETLFFNQRLIISQAIKEPLAWRVTKVEDLNPRGVRRITFAADKFDQYHDFIEKDGDGSIVGMWADYWQTAVEPTSEEQSSELFTSITSRITFPGASQIRVGGSKTLTITYYEDDTPIDHDTGEWTFSINGEDASSLLTVSQPSANKVKVKFNGGDDYIGSILKIINTSEDGITSSADVEIIAF